MPVTTQITGTVVLPDGTAPQNGFIHFTPIGWDGPADGGVKPPAARSFPLGPAGGLVDVTLIPTTGSMREMPYRVEISHYNPATLAVERTDLGLISVPEVAEGDSVSIRSLLSDPGVIPTAPDALAQVTAKALEVDADRAAAQTARTAAEAAAAAAAAAAASITLSPMAFGAFGDGNSHTMTSLAYATLAAAQVDYPQAISLNDEADLCAIRAAVAAIAAAGGGRIAAGGLYRINRSIDTTDNLVASLRIKPTSAMGAAPIWRQQVLTRNVRLIDGVGDYSDNAAATGTDYSNSRAFFSASDNCVDGLWIDRNTVRAANTPVYLARNPRHAFVTGNYFGGVRVAGVYCRAPVACDISGNTVNMALNEDASALVSGSLVIMPKALSSRGRVGIWALDIGASGVPGVGLTIRGNRVFHSYNEGIIVRGYGWVCSDNIVYDSANETAGATYGIIFEGSDTSTHYDGGSEGTATGNLTLYCDGGYAIRHDPADATATAPKDVTFDANVALHTGAGHAFQVGFGSIPVIGLKSSDCRAKYGNGAGWSIGIANDLTITDTVIEDVALQGITSYSALSTGIVLSSPITRRTGKAGISVIALAAGERAQIRNATVIDPNASGSTTDFDYVGIMASGEVIIDSPVIRSSNGNMRNGIRASSALASIYNPLIEGHTVSRLLGTSRPIMPRAEMLYATATWDCGSLAAGASAFTAVSVGNVALGDNVVSVSWDISQPDIALRGVVSSAGTVRVYAENRGATTIDPASATLRVIVARTSVL